MATDRICSATSMCPGCVGTLMTNMAVEVALKARNVQFVRAKVGDRYVLEELSHGAGSWAARVQATCWRWTSTPPGTALISALQVLQACVRSGKTWPSCWPG
jgi:phosphoglucosamine mutase